MVVGVLRLELMLHGAASLKEKRSVIRKILMRCRNRFPVSCAETGLHDLWQSAQLGFACVEVSEPRIRCLFEQLEQAVDQIETAEVVDRFVEILHY